ncbi:coilin [Silurus asotus]|uniref:Coilin n=1 Tax=Silurus asotus TaxID=30991 RepID=A0AAD5B5C1_SILAS|nr:coilin [Silurus asotus]
MAASSVNAVRVRLYFDYPPPCMPDCRMSWLLVDLNKCRVVADLCSVIREKFDYSRKTALDLFIENCFLPPAENIYVVRDNDSIRVKVSSVPCEYAGKKRRREEEGSLQAPTKKTREEAGEANGVTPPAGLKKKKQKEKKKKPDESGEAYKSELPSAKSQTDKNNKKASAASVLTNGNAISSDSSEEVTQKPAQSKSKQVASKRPASRKSSSSKSSSSEDENVPGQKSPKPSTSLKTRPGTKTSKELKSSITPKSTAKKTQPSSDSSSSEEEASGAAVKKANADPKSSSGKQKSCTVTSKAQPQTVTTSSSSEDDDDDSRKTNSLTGKTSSVQNAGKTVALPQTRPSPSIRSRTEKPSGNSKMSKTQTSSGSSASSSSEDEASKSNAPATPKPVVKNGAAQPPSTPVGTTLPDNKDKAENSDSSSDTELVIKKPNPQLMIGLTPRGRGRGFPDRLRGRGGVRGGFGRARGTPWKQNFNYNYDNGDQRKQKEFQTNRSLVLQNPPEPAPQRDYSALPLLAAPPAVGQKIVFKLLELNENYSPEVSDYKEAKIIGFNHSTNMVELELLTQSHVRTEPGKFDLVYENPDGSERVEYAITMGSQLTERWESLLEPRLIVQNTE